MNRQRRRAAAARTPNPHGSRHFKTGQIKSGDRDLDLLRAGRLLVDQTPDVFAVAADAILVVVDCRDRIGADLAALSFHVEQRMDRRDADDIIARQLDGFPAGALVPVCFWMPPGVLLKLLTALGFGVPAEWPEAIEQGVADGQILTFLKRGGRGLILAVDYDEVPRLDLPAVSFGGGDGRVAS